MVSGIFWFLARIFTTDERGNFLGRFSLKSVARNMLVAVGVCLFGIVIWWGFLDFLDFFDFLELMEEEWWRRWCLGVGGTRWWVRYRFPRVCTELWEDFPNSLPFFFNFCHDAFLVSLERRSGECGWGAYWQMCWSAGEFETWSILKWDIIVHFRNGCWGSVGGGGMRWCLLGGVFSVNESGLLLPQGQLKLQCCVVG